MNERMELPDGWVETTLGEIISISSGKGLTQANQNSAGEYLVYGGNGIVGKHIEYLFENKTLIIGRVGVHCGNLHIAKPKSWITDNAFVVDFNSNAFDITYLYYHLKVLNLNKYSSSTAQPVISQGKLYPVKIQICPLPEQHRIVTKIEALFSSLDRGMASLKTAQQQLKIYRQAVLKWAFEGKLTNESVKEGELPEGWKWVKVGDVVKKMDQGWSPKCENERSTSNEEWAVIKTTAIQHNLFIETANKKLPLELKPRTQHELQKNDILITRAGPRVRVGVCCLVKNVRPKLLNCDKAYRIKVSEEVITPGFLVQVLNSPQFLEILEVCKSGGNDSGLNLTQNVFLDISIPLPICIEEQHNIVAAIESRLSVCDKLEETILQSLQQAEALRQSILKKAFAGQLVPQDPNDEPASALLERIRAERLKATASKIVKNKKSKK